MLTWLPSLRMLAFTIFVLCVDIFCPSLQPSRPFSLFGLLILIFVVIRLDVALMSRLYYILFAMDVHFHPQKEENNLVWSMILSPWLVQTPTKRNTEILSYVTMMIRTHKDVFESRSLIQHNLP